MRIHCRMPSILRNSSRYRRDQRQLEEEEEMWFNEEDDFSDVPTTKVNPELDNSIGECANACVCLRLGD